VAVASIDTGCKSPSGIARLKRAGRIGSDQQMPPTWWFAKVGMETAKDRHRAHTGPREKIANHAANTGERRPRRRSRVLLAIGVAAPTLE